MPDTPECGVFLQGRCAAPVQRFLEEFAAADLAVANLECPLIEQQSPISKTGPVLDGSAASVNGMVRSHIRCLGLANNHILDHGATGLESTLRACACAGIKTFGAGRNLEEAARMLVVNAGPLRVGLMGVSEQEWSIAAENSSGANPVICRVARTLRLQRHNVDFSIILLHDGAEYYPFPSPRLRKVCRFLIEEGAGMVVCQHSHCAGAFEAYRGGHIIYGQGNLISDSPDGGDTWYEGFLVQLSLGRDLRPTWQPIPHTQSAPPPGARRMSPERSRAFLKSLAERSQAIMDDKFVAQSWAQFCRDQRHSLMSYVLGHGRLLRRLNRNGSVVRHVHGKRRLRELRNCVVSDTNREVFLGVLDQYLEEE